LWSKKKHAENGILSMGESFQKEKIP
jgi:hypothetical protein